MSKNFDKEIYYVSILAENLVKELKEFQKDIEKEIKNNPDYKTPWHWANKHKASFNRLRIELNNKCLELSKMFKEYRR